MPQPRIPLEPERMYHIWTHANGSENLFRTDENYRYFLDKYTWYIQPVADTFAYCLMPNHLHLMVRVKGEEDVLEYIRERKSNPTPPRVQNPWRGWDQLFFYNYFRTNFLRILR
jgi:REP element-mobilizing transposase RayT